MSLWQRFRLWWAHRRVQAPAAPAFDAPAWQQAIAAVETLAAQRLVNPAVANGVANTVRLLSQSCGQWLPAPWVSVVKGPGVCLTWHTLTGYLEITWREQGREGVWVAERDGHQGQGWVWWVTVPTLARRWLRPAPVAEQWEC